MDDVATKIIEILRKNMKDPSKAVTLETPLSDLEIESLDLAVIVFDIEDTFGIEIPYNANEEVEAFATVGSVVDRVKGYHRRDEGFGRSSLISHSARAPSRDVDQASELQLNTHGTH